MNHFKMTMAAVAALALGSAAQAAPVLWTMDNVTLFDGATASGTFTYDADTGTIGSFDLSVSGHIPFFRDNFGFTDYTVSSSSGGTASYSSQYNTFFFDAGAGRSLDLTVTSSLTNAGGTVPLSLDTNQAFFTADVLNGFGIQAISGSVTSDGAGAVPEAASWAMMLGGFGLVGGAMRRRKVAVSFA